MKISIKFIWHSKLSLTLLMGLLLGLSFPPFPLPFLVFPAFLLLFRLIDLCNSAREAAYWSYPGFVLWNIIVTYWLVMATVAGGIAAILANAAVMTVPVMLQFYVQKYLHRWWNIALLQTAFWVSYEYLHHQWDLAWPWLALGNAWADFPELVQYISATGYLGISFWIVLISALAYQSYKTTNQMAGYSALAIAIIFPIASLVQLAFVENHSDSYTSVVVAQPNFDSYEQYGGFDHPEQALDMIIELSDSTRTEQTDMLIWPENSIYPPLHSESGQPRADQAKQKLQNLSTTWDVSILGGATFYEYYEEPNRAPALSRSSGDRSYLYYNSALGFYPDSTLEVYQKHNLVPIVERLPFVHTLNKLDIFNIVSWEDVQGYGKGKEATPFPVSQTETTGLVCYDSVFPSWVRSFVKNGSGFITVITNDGWWGNTSGHIQHFSYAKLRALEFRRWVVRSANNGISGVIAADGSVKLKTEYWTRTAFQYSVPVLTRQTFYAKYGDWLPWLMLLFSLTVSGWMVYSRSVRTN